MAMHSTVCPGCLEAVPAGRPSCPGCGRTLAAATGDAAGPPAGAYVPPSAAMAAPDLLPARAWAGITSVAPRPTGTVVASPGSASPGSMSQAPAATAPSAAATRIGLQAGGLAAVAGWSMAIGSAVAILGFLLPWSRTVIGAEGAGTYFDTWGMASPSHVLVVLALAAALGMAIVANPIPSWVRTCCVGLVLGGLLVGLTWPYLLGPLGAGPGVVAILVGGMLLGVAGLLDLVEAYRPAPASDD